MTRYALATALAGAVLAVPAPALAEGVDTAPADACVVAYYTDGHFCATAYGEVLGEPVRTRPCR